MENVTSTPVDQKSGRLYYLDWLRVIAILGVFLFHAVHPFDHIDWHIKNGELSSVVTFFIAFMFPWGMPFFFFLAGAGSFFALRRRTAGQFSRERFNRLMVPYFIGALALMPIMLYFEWLHKTQAGLLKLPFLDFVLDRNVGFTPIWFGALGYHLWFLGFLFSFSILCLPVFLWLNGNNGQRLTFWLARTCQRRGAILLFFIPLALVRLALHPFFPQEHSWADFFVQSTFFLFGYLMFSHETFLQAIRRDWTLTLASGILAGRGRDGYRRVNWELGAENAPQTALDVLFWILVAIDGWCWTLFVVFIGMRYLDFSNKHLEYGQQAILPFFVFHQPVIIILAYYAVQLPVSLLIKMLLVVVGSFVLTLGIYEFLIRRIAWLSRLFGMKAAPRAMTDGVTRQPVSSR